MKRNLIGALTKSVCFLVLLYSSPLVAQDDDSTYVDTTAVDSAFVEEVEATSPFPFYVEPLSYDEVQEVKSGWNTSAVIEDYRSVPNPQTTNSTWVSDPHNILSANGIDTLNRFMQMLKDSTTSEMVVVCINSIGENDPHMYATDLFNHWGVGDAETNNGLLIMVVLDIRKASIITGRGMEQHITDLETAEVRDNEMIPFFKEEDYTTGVTRGVQVFIEMIYGVPPEYLQAANQDYDYSTTDYDYSDDYDYWEEESVPFFERPLVSLYLKLAILLSFGWIVVLLAALFMKDLHKRYNTMKFFTLLFFPVFMPIPFLGFYFLTKKLMEKWRNTERFSHHAGEYMHKLTESEEDEFLTKGQIAEEVIKSIDYDVWVTPNKEEVLILAYKRWFSKFRKCPKCKYTTWFKKYDKVIKAASYSSSGTGQRKFACKNCSHSKTTTYTIPKKTASSSSSGGYSGGSSYGGGSSYSGGSSSGGSSYSGGGSSFGGGSSGGGGSTGGW